MRVRKRRDKRKSKDKIFIKIWIYIASVTSAVIILFVLLQVIKIESWYYNSVQTNLNKQLNTFSQKLLDDPDDYSIFFDFESKKDGVILLLDKDFLPVYKTETNIERSNDLYQKILNNYKTSIITESGSQSILNKNRSNTVGNYLFKAAYIDNDYYLVLFQNPVFSSQLGEALVFQYIVIALVSIILSSFIAYIVSTDLVLPIIEAEKVAKQITKGNFATIKNIQGNNELSSLMKSINIMSDSLKASEAQSKRLISSISHELKTPISSIKVYNELISDEEDIAIIRSYCKEIEIGTTKLHSMVEEILAYSKYQSGLESPVIIQFNLITLINNIIDELHPISESKGLRIITNYPVNKILIRSDYKNSRVIIKNILNNAVNYSVNNSDIIINVVISEDTVSIDITNQGIGIPDDEISLIWNEFYKCSNNDLNIGTGLGLSIVKHLCNMLSIEYAITKQDQNTVTFTLLYKV